MPRPLPGPARAAGMLITPAVALAAFTGAAPAPTPASALAAAVSSAGQPAPAGQQFSAAPVPAGSVRVTVSLSAADPAGLLRAAHLPPSFDVSGRAARLRALEPSGAARARVTGYLHAHGFALPAATRGPFPLPARTAPPNRSSTPG